MAHNKNKNLTRQEDLSQKQRDFHDHNLTLLPDIMDTLFTAIDIIESKNIPYALIGGVAGKELGRPRVTHDIDLFIRPDDADAVLDLFERNGFEIEKRDINWLYKAWKNDVLVDIIFRSCGDIYFEEEVRNHVRRIPINGKMINAISPEDFIVIKAAAHREDNPHHWHDALSVLKQGNIDWDYLLRRARYCPRRILSQLIYAQSNDIAVPTEVIKKLFRQVFEQPEGINDIVHHPYLKKANEKTSASGVERGPPIYMKGKIIEALTKDDRIAEHDIKIALNNSAVIIKGEVFTEQQKDAVNEVIHQIAPDLEIKNYIHVRVLTPPEGSEVIL